MAPWSSGQDASLSRWNQGFDSPGGHLSITLKIEKSSVFFYTRNFTGSDEDKNIILRNMKKLQICILLLTLFDTSKEDFKTKEIPTRGILIPVLFTMAGYFIEGRLKLLEIILGSLVISVPFLIAALISKGGIGGGDIKLVWAWGMYLGPAKILYAAFLSLILAALATFPLIKQKKYKEEIPLGPFLCMGIFLAIVF